jgi:thioredoxin-related protein
MCLDNMGSSEQGHDHFSARDLARRLLVDLADDFRFLVDKLNDRRFHSQGKGTDTGNAACAEKGMHSAKQVESNDKVASVPKETRPIEWQADLVAAYKKAKDENKPMVVLFSDPSCHYCQLLKDGALKDPRVLAMSDRAEFVVAEPAREANAKYMADSLNITGYPTTVVLDAQPNAINEKGRVTGFFQPDSFVKQLEACLPPPPKPAPEAAEDFIALIQSELIDFGSFDKLFGSLAKLPA